MMRRVRPEIETYTERSWKMLDLPELEDLARDYDEFNQLLLSGRLPYDYFAFANARDERQCCCIRPRRENESDEARKK